MIFNGVYDATGKGSVEWVMASAGLAWAQLGLTIAKAETKSDSTPSELHLSPKAGAGTHDDQDPKADGTNQRKMVSKAHNP